MWTSLSLTFDMLLKSKTFDLSKENGTCLNQKTTVLKLHKCLHINMHNMYYSVRLYSLLSFSYFMYIVVALVVVG